MFLTRISTPLGPMAAGAVDQGICLLEFEDGPTLGNRIEKLCRSLGTDITPGDSPHFTTLSTQLEEYFAGTRKGFDLPLVISGTPFQKLVWDELSRIPYGQTRTYAGQAQNIRRPTAVRAVAGANSRNRLAIIIPCHRVIGSGGNLTGYAAGLHRKQYLLDLEAGRRT